MSFGSISRPVILLFSLLWVFAGTIAAFAQETPIPQDCADCHIDVVASWQNSTHAKAYENTVFQGAWQVNGRRTECLTCHTTGYLPATGEYEHEGVMCEACHGETPSTHPPEALVVDSGVRVCTDCHPTTYAEWQMSAHGTQQLACTTCHAPHPQTLRFETSTALCLNCHDEPLTDYAHVSHPEQQCVECHWHKGSLGPEHVMTGNLMPTGHDGAVETRTCLDCHAELSGTELVSAGTGEQPLLQAQVRIHELEAELQTSRVESDNAALSLGAQGLLAGAAFTGLLAAGLFTMRRRSGGGKKE